MPGMTRELVASFDLRSRRSLEGFFAVVAHLHMMELTVEDPDAERVTDILEAVCVVLPRKLGDRRLSPEQRRLALRIYDYWYQAYPSIFRERPDLSFPPLEVEVMPGHNGSYTGAEELRELLAQQNHMLQVLQETLSARVLPGSCPARLGSLSDSDSPNIDPDDIVEQDRANLERFTVMELPEELVTTSQNLEDSET